MELRPEYIGSTHTAHAPNGTRITVTIKDDPSQFKLYALLKLNVFKVTHHVPPKKTVVNISAKSPEDMTWPELKQYAKENGIPIKSKEFILDELSKK
jgi:hypothetical protein